MQPPSSEHIVASISEPGAGPSYSVRALAGALADHGADVGVSCVAGWRGYADPPPLPPQVAWTVYPQDMARRPLLGAVCLSAAMARGVRSLATSKAVLHGHGLWLMPNIYPAWAAAGAGGAKLVVSPRGMLATEALAFSPLRKRAFWHVFQRRALARAACLHATSEAECADIRAAGLANPVAVIPNGVEIPKAAAPACRAGQRTVLSLGRIHPKKGLDRLVRAWARIEPTAPDWRLRIVGPAELGHDRELVALARSLGLERVSIEGPLYNAARLAAYAAAELFVLPTRSENFAMTVAEALAAGTPVISTRGAPWQGLERERCGWWVDHGVEAIADALGRATAKPAPELAAMGARGRAWMERDFAWPRIAQDMLAVYRWVSGAGERPECVQDA